MLCSQHRSLAMRGENPLSDDDIDQLRTDRVLINADIKHLLKCDVNHIESYTNKPMFHESNDNAHSEEVKRLIKLRDVMEHKIFGL
jgi:hypothetical protein